MVKVLLSLLAIIALSVSNPINMKPVIGVFMQRSSYADEGYPPTEWSYIAASYVKYSEMAGSRVIPVYYDGDKAYYDRILTLVNGFLFPGGDAPFGKTTKLGQNLMYVLQKVKDLNKAGQHFPIWGTCNGFEELVTLVADFEDLLTPIEGEVHVSRKLNIENPGRLYGSMPNELFYNVQHKKLSFFNHHFALKLSDFNKSQKLRKFFTLLATAKNDAGDEFVAVLEAKEFPIYAVQFHPEKNIFEWKVDADHGIDAVVNSQYYADYFVQQSRQNYNSAATQEALQPELIYNYNATALQSSSFTQIYLFKNYNVTHPEEHHNLRGGFQNLE